jgi:hypothetical protein
MQAGLSDHVWSIEEIGRCSTELQSLAMKVWEVSVKRTLLRIVLAAGFIGAGWSLGNAQAPVADFEITIDAPRGEVRVTCSRGCDWAKERGNPSPMTGFRCETERCRETFNGHGRILLGMPR